MDIDWKSVPSLAALRAFDSVARNQGYSGAARALNVTEAAMRQHVRGLEQALGCSLVERKGRGLVLTDSGRLLFASTSESFETLIQGVENLRDIRAGDPIRIAVTPAFAENWLMARLADFWVGHPDIEIELVPSLKLVDLGSDGLDIAIRYGRGEWPACRAVHLASARYVVVARADILNVSATDDLRDLKSVPWLFETGRNEHRVWVEQRGIEFEANTNRFFPTNSLVISAARAGHGLSLQAKALVENDLETGALREVYSEEPGTLGYYLVTRGELREPVRLFTKWLMHQVQT